MSVPGCFMRSGFFASAKTFFQKYSLFFGSFHLPVVEGLRKGKFYPLSRLRKEVNIMNEPERTEWQIRCAFNGFCKRTLKNESINAHRDIRKRQEHEINFSGLTPKEENQLYTHEDFFAGSEEEQPFSQAVKNEMQRRLPMRSTACRKKNAEPSCSTTSLIWVMRKLQNSIRFQEVPCSIGVPALLSY